MTMTIDTASRQYRSRPQDERYPSLAALVESATAEKNLSAERIYNLKDLTVRPAGDGLELVSPKGAAAMTHWAFGKLARTVGAPAGYLRDSLTPELAAACLNHGMADSPAGTSVNLLVRGQNGLPPMIRDVASDTYGRVWDADLYGEIARTFRHDDRWTLPPTWTGEPAGAYRGDRDSFLIYVNGGSIVTDPSAQNNRPYVSMADAKGDAGSMFRGLLVRNSEVGASSVVLESILFRYVCGNHMLWGAVVDKRFRRRHVGTRALRDTIREISRIAYQWTNRTASADETIIRGLIDREIAHTRDAVIDELRAMGATKEQAESAYETCERTEAAAPRSFWGIAQGLTRDSQTSGYQDERFELDRLAAMVLARGAKLVAA